MEVLNINTNWEDVRSIIENEVGKLEGACPLLGLCGGRSVRYALKLLNECRSSVKLEALLIDERLVPLDHPDSNYRLLIDELRAFPSLKEKLVIHPFKSDGDESCLEEYRKLLDSHGNLKLLFLGAGEDGHVASIFPNLENTHRSDENFFTISNSPKPPPSRMTASLNVIKEADLVILFVLGESKREAFNLILDANISPLQCPAKYALLAKRCIILTDLN